MPSNPGSRHNAAHHCRSSGDDDGARRWGEVGCQPGGRLGRDGPRFRRIRRVPALPPGPADPAAELSNVAPLPLPLTFRTPPHRSAQRSRRPARPSPAEPWERSWEVKSLSHRIFPGKRGMRGSLRVVNDGRSRSGVGNVCAPVGKQEGFSRRRILRPPSPAAFDLMGFEIPLEIRD